jgi:hypothetical protein
MFSAANNIFKMQILLEFYRRIWYRTRENYPVSNGPNIYTAARIRKIFLHSAYFSERVGLSSVCRDRILLVCFPTRREWYDVAWLHGDFDAVTQSECDVDQDSSLSLSTAWKRIKYRLLLTVTMVHGVMISPSTARERKKVSGSLFFVLVCRLAWWLYDLLMWRASGWATIKWLVPSLYSRSTANFSVRFCTQQLENHIAARPVAAQPAVVSCSRPPAVRTIGQVFVFQFRFEYHITVPYDQILMWKQFWRHWAYVFLYEIDPKTFYCSLSALLL